MKEAQFSGTNQVVEPKEVKVSTKGISLVEVPTQYGLAFQTPEGLKDSNEYLVWLGNMILEMKLTLAGN